VCKKCAELDDESDALSTAAVSPLVMIPSRRLPHLIEQAQQWQKTMDPFYNLPPDAQLSLYIDHQSDRSVFPTQTAAILKGHSDEVWHVAFSNDGTRLASVGQDKEAIIWTVGPTQDDFQILHRYGPHTGPICHAAWSPDDTMLLTSTQDGEVNVWNLNTGSKKEYREHIYSVGTATWLPDNVHFVTGGMDHKIVLWNIDGTKQHTWLTTPYRVQALAVSPDGKHLVALSIRTLPTPGSASSNLHGQGGAASAARSWTRSADEAVRTAAAGVSGNGNSSILIDDEVDDLGGGSRIEGDERQRILFFDLDKREEVGSVYLWDELTSVTFSDDSRHILVNQRPNESQIWNVQRQCLIMRLNGHKVQKHVIRSCFGGVERSFVISGSEDALIYVYHRKTGKLLEKLKGHGEGSVNSVAWHPTHHSMFASCSDDGTVRIWKPKAGGRSYADEILRMPASSDGHATNGHDRDSSMTEPSPFPWSNSPRSPASPTVMPSLAAVRSSAAVSSSLIVPSSEQTGEDEEEDEEEDDDEEDEEDDDDDDDDVMAE
jgi:WD40 repeat protein